MSHARSAKRVVHLTSVHPRDDIRIFRKECVSLARSGLDVHLVVADGLGAAMVDGVHIHDVGASSGRLRRMLALPGRVLRAARALGGDLYHFHDPELIPVAAILSRSAAVIYDSHEDLPRAVMSKDWIAKPLRRVIAQAVEQIEHAASRRFAAVIGATPHIARRFGPHSRLSVAVNNYLLPHEIVPAERTSNTRQVCYLGALSRQRGVLDMVRAMEHVDAQLVLAGSFSDAAVEREARALPSWSRVDYRGVVSREETRRIMANSAVGLVVLHPEPNYVESRPTKLFEYMSAALPVLASDFPLWQEIVEGVGAGRCVSPGDPRAIARAIKEMLEDPQAARKMGGRGLRAVQSKYLWTAEEAVLYELYSRILAVEVN